jgi:hypothetical protein
LLASRFFPSKATLMLHNTVGSFAAFVGSTHHRQSSYLLY